MTPTLLMTISGSVWVILFFAVTYSFATFARRITEFELEDSVGAFMRNGILGALLSVDSLIFVGAFVWFLVERS